LGSDRASDGLAIARGSFFVWRGAEGGAGANPPVAPHAFDGQLGRSAVSRVLEFELPLATFGHLAVLLDVAEFRSFARHGGGEAAMKLTPGRARDLALWLAVLCVVILLGIGLAVWWVDRLAG